MLGHVKVFDSLTHMNKHIGRPLFLFYRMLKNRLDCNIDDAP